MEIIQGTQEILTVEDTARYLRICRVSAYNLFHSESFPCFQVGRSLRICKTDLLNWVKANLNNSSN